MIEPNPIQHEIFETYEEAQSAYDLLSDEQKELIFPPRQSIDCWIFDKEPEEWQ